MKHFKFIIYLLFLFSIVSCTGHFENKTIPMQIDRVTYSARLNCVKAVLYSDEFNVRIEKEFPGDMYEKLLDIYTEKVISGTTSKVIYVDYPIWVSTKKSNKKAYGKY